MHNFCFYIHFYGATLPHRLPVLEIKVPHLPLPTLQQPLSAVSLCISRYNVRLFVGFPMNMLPIILLGWPKSSFGFFHKMVQKTPNELFVQANTWYLVLYYPGLVSSLQCGQRCPFLFLLSSFLRGTFRFSDSQGATLVTLSPSSSHLPHPIPLPSLVNLVQWLSLVPRASTWVPSLTPRSYQRPLIHLPFQTCSSFFCVPRGVVIASVQVLFFYSTLGFPCGSAGKESACNVGDLGSIPGLGRSPGERKVFPLQYSGLENSMDCIVHGVARSRTQLSDFHFTYSALAREDDFKEEKPWPLRD